MRTIIEEGILRGGLSVIGAGTYSRARLIDPQIMYRDTMKALAPEMELL